MTSSVDDDWPIKLQALEEYRSRHGHVHVGFSSEDDADLARFARMQRAASKKDTLTNERQVTLKKESQTFLSLPCHADRCVTYLVDNRKCDCKKHLTSRRHLIIELCKST